MIYESLPQLLSRAESATARQDHAAAASYFARAVTLEPTNVTLALALANALQMAGQLEPRIAALRLAFQQGDRSDVNTAHALGAALLDAGEAQLAVRCFEFVKQQKPNDPAALSALAAALRANGEPGRAWPLVKRATDLAPRSGPHLLTAAQVRHDLGDLDGALAWLDQDEVVRPGHESTRRQRAWTSLMRGATNQSWALFEARALPISETNARAWRGEPLDGQSILVAAEQGVGDQLQFLRFVYRLKEFGAGPIVVECHADLVTLLVANGFTAVPRGNAPPTAWHVPIGSLPHWLKTGEDLLSGRVPYLRAPRESLSDSLSDSLSGSSESLLPNAQLPGPNGASSRRRLGLVWAGNPSFPGRATRDLDPASLPDIVGIPGIEWVSLQQGTAAAALPDGVRCLLPLGSWSETASVLSRLDGLVTTDTGIAHLAGAMGIPLWVMLQRVPDWRWGLAGEKSAWYPSARLLRQGRTGGWNAVVAELRQLLSGDAPINDFTPPLQ